MAVQRTSHKTLTSAIDVTLVTPQQFKSMTSEPTPASDHLVRLFAARKARLAAK